MLDALAAKAATIIGTHEIRSSDITQQFASSRPAFERSSRLTSYHARGRSRSSDSNDSNIMHSKARSRSRSLTARLAPSKSADSQNESELISQMNGLSIRKTVSNTDNTSTLFQSMEPCFPQSLPHNARISTEYSNSRNAHISTEYSNDHNAHIPTEHRNGHKGFDQHNSLISFAQCDEPQEPLDLSPTGSQIIVFPQNNLPEKQPRLQSPDTNTNTHTHNKIVGKSYCPSRGSAC